MQAGVEPFTIREMDILRLLAHGFYSKEMADELVITEGTVKNHVTNILGSWACATAPMPR